MTTNGTALRPPMDAKADPRQVTLELSHRDPEHHLSDGDPLIPELRSAVKRPTIVLEHKIRVKNTFCDWLCFAAYALGMYGFMILMIVLLLKATKKDSQAVGITYFAVFIFFVIALLTVVFCYQRKMKKLSEAERRPTG